MISYQKCHPVVHVYMSLMYFLVYFQQCITKIIFKLFIFHCTFSRMQHAVFSVTVLEGPANLLLYDGRNIDVDLMFKVKKSVLCFGHLVHSFFGNTYCDFFYRTGKVPWLQTLSMKNIQLKNSVLASSPVYISLGYRP